MGTTHALGNLVEAEVLVALLRKGYTVLKPFGDGCRYDLVYESAGIFRRVQCKAGRLRKGAILFNTQSAGLDYAKDADEFGVYCVETDRVYLIPVSRVGKGIWTMRVEATRNNQAKKITWAEEFALQPASTPE